MNYRKLEISDADKLDKLIDDTFSNLANEKFFLPISQDVRDLLFDDEQTYFLGAFSSDNLVGAAALLFSEKVWGESRDKIGLDSSSVVEFGLAMVDPSSRGHGIMNTLSSKLLEIALTSDADYLIATVHPDNTPSQKVIKSLGMKKEGFCIKPGGYERDIYLRNLKN